MFKYRSRLTTTIWAVIAVATAMGLWRILPKDLRQQVEPIAHATSTYIVNTTDDHDDGVCNAADCTLREAINAANALVNSNTSPRNINFSIQIPHRMFTTIARSGRRMVQRSPS